jgi:hypothetical protein
VLAEQWFSLLSLLRHPSPCTIFREIPLSA